jgi:uncharacterized membrane protein YhaH (DUF805 family)
MNIFKKILYDYNNFTGVSGRLEYGLYQILNVSLYFIIPFSLDLSIEDYKTNKVFYLFLVLIYILIIHVPLNAVTTRRIRDLGHNRVFVFFSWIPILNIIFKIYLVGFKGKSEKDVCKKKREMKVVFSKPL